MKVLLVLALASPCFAGFVVPIHAKSGVLECDYTIGVIAGATNGYDVGLDRIPGPPGGISLISVVPSSPTRTLVEDYRGSSTTWRVQVYNQTPDSLRGPLTLTWAKPALPAGHLTIKLDGMGSYVDMAMDGTLTTFVEGPDLLANGDIQYLPEPCTLALLLGGLLLRPLPSCSHRRAA